MFVGQLDKSVLDPMALENGIPMLNACKGKARCSTCRVLVLNGTPNERTEKEAFLAQRLEITRQCAFVLSTDNK